MTIKEAFEVIVNRGYINGIFVGSKWRLAVYVISNAWVNGEISINEKE